MDKDIYFMLHPVFKVIKHFGIIGEGEDGMRKELNLISWDGRIPKYDIRCWSEDREHYSRGVTLHPMEMEHAIKLAERHMGTGE